MRIGDAILDYKFKNDKVQKIEYNGSYYKRIGILLSDFDKVSTPKYVHTWCMYFDAYEGYHSKNLIPEYIIPLEHLSIGNLNHILKLYETIFEHSSTSFSNTIQHYPLRIRDKETLEILKDRYWEYVQLKRQFKLERILAE
jgi:hypothetical protein